MEMVMPVNYVEMTDEEMMYVEGGYQYYKNVKKTNYKYSGWYYVGEITVGLSLLIVGISRTWTCYWRNVSYNMKADVWESEINKKVSSINMNVNTIEEKWV